MTRTLDYLCRNALAMLALVCALLALGGASYAAFSLPAGSVGPKQIRSGAVTSQKLANGSVTAAKFNAGQIRGSIRFWARIDANGRVIASAPRAQTIGWNSVTHSGRISWGQAIPKGCFSLATVDSVTSQGFASVATLNQPRPPAFVVVDTFTTTGQPAGEPVNVMVVCP
jgi:hypothetical protein